MQTVQRNLVLRECFQSHSSYVIILCPSHPRMSRTCAHGHTRLSLVGARGVMAEERAKSLHVPAALLGTTEISKRIQKRASRNSKLLGARGRAFEAPPSTMTQAGADTHGLPRNRTQSACDLLWQ